MTKKKAENCQKVRILIPDSLNVADQLSSGIQVIISGLTNHLYRCKKLMINKNNLQEEKYIACDPLNYIMNFSICVVSIFINGEICMYKKGK